MRDFHKQVEKRHYAFGTYYTQARWASIWHQLDEVLRFDPDSVLEVGGGLGIFKQTLGCLGVPVTVADIAEDLNPDVVGSVTALPFDGKSFDVACAFQVLEHLPFSAFPMAVSELARVARKAVIISLPDAKTSYGVQVHLPRLGKKSFWVTIPFKRSPVSTPEHFWELEQKGYPLGRILKAMRPAGFQRIRTYRADGNRYHRFFIANL
jgi:ubiquinone/menaquinone biosynthesis C-methylase UbiE